MHFPCLGFDNEVVCLSKGLAAGLHVVGILEGSGGKSELAG